MESKQEISNDILSNSVYTPESGILRRLSTKLCKLSFSDLNDLRAVLGFKSPPQAAIDIKPMDVAIVSHRSSGSILAVLSIPHLRPRDEILDVFAASHGITDTSQFRVDFAPVIEWETLVARTEPIGRTEPA